MSSWFAHSHPALPRERWHTLRDHLTSVGEHAGLSARKFAAEEIGRVAGLLHDLGKYSLPFQAKLEGDARRVDHSTAGAKIAVERYPFGKLVAAAIAGHHAGLADGKGGESRSSLQDRLTLSLGTDLPTLELVWQAEIKLPQRLVPPRLACHRDRKIAEKRFGFQLAFFVRMFFSCLVDADYLDTEAWFCGVEGVPQPRGEWPSIAELKTALDGYLARIQLSADPTLINAARGEVLAASRAAAELPPGLFSLTVPTGGGKTLSGLAFALDHAARWQLDRVIYVAPFTSVIEQNADVFRTAIAPWGSAVLEHHSTFSDEETLHARRKTGGEEGPEAQEKLKLAMENWDAPVIATTAVQFFESLFSATPSRCRKLHNIARSVVILDEAQTLPLPLLRPCIAAIDELARNYGTSIVLCTATQPAIEDRDRGENNFHGGLCDVRPILAAEQRDSLFQRLRRVRIKALDVELSDEELAARLRGLEQVLCVVNTRGHARAVFEAIRAVPGARHLSTWMCAAHRAKVLAEIRCDLAHGFPCRVVSTSLVEAGVDVDFPCVFRAEAGLDSIVQAAGRCNREGKRSANESSVHVFRPANRAAPKEIEQFATAMRGVVRRYSDVLAPTAIEAYFREVYWLKSAGRNDELDRHAILEKLNEQARELLFPFETVERAFRIIEDGQLPLIVPYDGEAKRNIEALRHATRVGLTARRLQRYVVPVHPKIFARLHSAGAIAPVRDGDTGRQFYELANCDLYREEVGLVWSEPTFLAVERAII